MELPNGVKSVEELARFYQSLEVNPAYKDLVSSLLKRKEKAIELLRQQDDPVARATWNLVDDILDRKNFIEKEAKKEIQNKQDKEKNK